MFSLLKHVYNYGKGISRIFHFSVLPDMWVSLIFVGHDLPLPSWCSIWIKMLTGEPDSSATLQKMAIYPTTHCHHKVKFMNLKNHKNKNSIKLGWVKKGAVSRRSCERRMSMIWVYWIKLQEISKSIKLNETIDKRKWPLNK